MTGRTPSDALKRANSVNERHRSDSVKTLTALRVIFKYINTFFEILLILFSFYESTKHHHLVQSHGYLFFPLLSILY